MEEGEGGNCKKGESERGMIRRGETGRQREETPEHRGERGRSETGHAKTRRRRGERQAGNSRRRIQAAIFLPSFPQLPLPPGKEGRGSARGREHGPGSCGQGGSEGPRLSAGGRQEKPNKEEGREKRVWGRLRAGSDRGAGETEPGGSLTPFSPSLSSSLKSSSPPNMAAAPPRPRPTAQRGIPPAGHSGHSRKGGRPHCTAFPAPLPRQAGQPARKCRAPAAGLGRKGRRKWRGLQRGPQDSRPAPRAAPLHQERSGSDAPRSPRPRAVPCDGGGVLKGRASLCYSFPLPSRCRQWCRLGSSAPGEPRGQSSEWLLVPEWVPQLHDGRTQFLELGGGGGSAAGARPLFCMPRPQAWRHLRPLPPCPLPPSPLSHCPVPPCPLCCRSRAEGARW